MLKNKFVGLLRLSSSKLTSRIASLGLALAMMVSVFIGNPAIAQADMVASSINSEVQSVFLIADVEEVEAEAVIDPDSPEAKAAAKLEAKQAKAAAKLEAKKLKDEAKLEAKKAKR
jgi:hypothetical protein